MKKKLFNVIACCCIIACSKAQVAGYKYYSQLDSVKTSGFYTIGLSPELTAHLKTDYSDIRIVNEAGKWIPHILRFPSAESGFFPLPILIIKKETHGSITELIIKNNGVFLSEFDILLKNTAASRVAKISGSDDLSKWFVVEDSFLLDPINANDTGVTKYHLEFPACNYKFFKVVIDNKLNDPVNILSASLNINLTFQQVNYNISPDLFCAVQQRDSGKISYLEVTQQKAFHFENIRLKLSGVKFFYRKVDMFIPAKENSSFADPGVLYQSFYISNNSALAFKVPLTNAKVFYLFIHNEDNLPLKAEGISTFCRTRSLTTYLEKGNSYRLIMDNLSAVPANYDLGQLNTAIPDSISFLGYGKVIAFKEIKPTAPATENKKWILWLAIIAALFILLFFTRKMIKEVDKKKTA
jgi:hypothetical protein